MGAPSDHPSAPPSDRRSAARLDAALPAKLRRGDSEGMVLVRDVSANGALLYAQIKMQTGDSVSLDLYLEAGTERAVSVTATIVRVARRDLKTADLWPYSVAVRFSAPKPEVEPLAMRL